MIKIPKHVRSIVEATVQELQEEIQQGYNVKYNSYHLEKVKEVQEKLKFNNWRVEDIEEGLRIMENIMNSIDGLTAAAVRKIFCEVKVDRKLKSALKNAKKLHPRMRKEIDAVTEFLKDVPNSAWGPEDEYADYRVFKLIKDKKEWEAIMSSGGTNLGIKMRDMPDFKYLRIGYMDKDMYMSSTTGKAKKTMNYLEDKLGDGFDVNMIDAFKKWFQIGTTGTYYIYVPK